jgi:hypothetical protein
LRTRRLRIAPPARVDTLVLSVIGVTASACGRSNTAATEPVGWAEGQTEGFA